MPPKAKAAEQPASAPNAVALLPEGSHRFTFRGGSVYEGEYKTVEGRVVRDGHGIFRENLCRRDPDDSPAFDPVAPDEASCAAQVFDGEWSCDRFVGGRVTYPDGSYFEGALDAAGAYGDGGLYRFADGSTWVGQYCGCAMHGDGVFTDAAGVSWRGRMVNNIGKEFIHVHSE